MDHNLKKSILATSIVFALGATNAEATLVANVLGNNTWSTDSANFTMLSSRGGVVFGGDNHVHIVWGGSAYNASSDYTGPGGASNVALSGTAPFFGHSWTAHDIQMFMPGSYSFNVTLGGGNPETGPLSATVGADQLGMHMLFDWGGDGNIDVFMVFAMNSIFGSGLLYSTQTNTNGQFTCDAGFTGTIIKNCLDGDPPYGSAGAPIKNQTWMLASVDGNGDGVMGIPMATGGPFAGFTWNINAYTATVVPVPAAAWLFGSGMLGLLGLARRKA